MDWKDSWVQVRVWGYSRNCRNYRDYVEVETKLQPSSGFGFSVFDEYYSPQYRIVLSDDGIAEEESGVRWFNHPRMISRFWNL